ncbi:hypothetical protein ACFXPX_36745 [Kitasatospora sp. NPDC059146]|uniref:hypothetical protein n=1 Tax=unclassified Kitasatospora TaxID=2633591 RepID=UPI003676FF88
MKLPSAPSFFVPGTTYVIGQPGQSAAQVLIFRCLYVAPDPVTGDPVAFGFDTPADPGNNWVSAAYDTPSWAAGWVNLGPTVRPEPQEQQPCPGDAEAAEPEAEKIEEPGPVKPGALVDYHGSQAAKHGLYRAQLCSDCPRCSRFGEDEPRYRLTKVADEKKLYCVRRESITPVPIGFRPAA